MENLSPESTGGTPQDPCGCFFLDARILFVLLIWAVHICLETFCIAIAGLIIFGVIELFGLTPKAALLLVKNRILGSRRTIGKAYFANRRCLR